MFTDVTFNGCFDCQFWAMMESIEAQDAPHLHPERVLLPVEVQRLVHVALEAAVVARHVAAQLLPSSEPRLWPELDRRLLVLLNTPRGAAAQ